MNKKTDAVVNARNTSIPKEQLGLVVLADAINNLAEAIVTWASKDKEN